MKNKLILPVVGLMVSILGGCGQSAGEIAEIVSERDSLRNLSKRQERRLERLDDIVEIVNGSLDSIVTEEGNLFISGSVEGGPTSKEDVMRNLARLEKLVSSQKEKISELEKKIAKESDDDDGLHNDVSLVSLVKSLKVQLKKKDEQIAALKDELSRKNVDIEQLRIQTQKQSRTILELDKRSNLQQEALKRQDAMLNQCYMVIASKKELESRGIIKKGKVVAQNALDRSKFNKVDIRKLTEITFSAKRPRILTPMPESAYELTTDGKGAFTLSITNPSVFWKVSNYLIIQTN